MLANTRKISSYSVYLILSFGYGLGFTTMTTYNGLYQFDIAHLNALQLVLVGTVLETVCFICQVPTGVLADLYSRRLSLIFGVLVVGAAFVLEGLIPTFVAIMIAQGLYGVGACFMGGAEEAWITDEVGEEKAAHAFLRGSQISQVGNVLGALLGAALATVRLNLPVVVGGGLIGRLDPSGIEQFGGRARLWLSAMSAIVDRPLGGGLGAFPYFFPGYRDRAVGPEFGLIDKAHSTYLELAAELTVPIMAALVVALGWLIVRMVRASQRLNPGAALAATGASVLVAVHSLFDFGLEIPAITVTWLLLLGAGLGQVEHYSERRSMSPRHRGSRHRVAARFRGSPKLSVVAKDH